MTERNFIFPLYQTAKAKHNQASGRRYQVHHGFDALLCLLPAFGYHAISASFLFDSVKSTQYMYGVSFSLEFLFCFPAAVKSKFICLFLRAACFMPGSFPSGSNHSSSSRWGRLFDADFFCLDALKCMVALSPLILREQNDTCSARHKAYKNNNKKQQA